MISGPPPPPSTAWQTPRHQVYVQQPGRDYRSWRDRSYPLYTANDQRHSYSDWSPTSDWQHDPRFVTPPRRPSAKSSPHRASRRRLSVQCRPIQIPDQSDIVVIDDLPAGDINAIEAHEISTRRRSDYKSSSNSRMFNVHQQQPYQSPRNRQQPYQSPHNQHHSRQQNKMRNGRQSSIESRSFDRSEVTNIGKPPVAVAHEDVAYV